MWETDKAKQKIIILSYFALLKVSKQHVIFNILYLMSRPSRDQIFFPTMFLCEIFELKEGRKVFLYFYHASTRGRSREIFIGWQNQGHFLIDKQVLHYIICIIHVSIVYNFLIFFSPHKWTFQLHKTCKFRLNVLHSLYINKYVSIVMCLNLHKIPEIFAVMAKFFTKT